MSPSAVERRGSRAARFAPYRATAWFDSFSGSHSSAGPSDQFQPRISRMGTAGEAPIPVFQSRIRVRFPDFSRKKAQKAQRAQALFCVFCASLRLNSSRSVHAGEWQGCG